MGKLVKSHLARLIVLTSAGYQMAAAIQGFFWPKIFWDFVTKNLDRAVKPFPILQVINLLFSILIIGWEWPFSFLAGTAMQRSIKARLIVLPYAALSASLMYQAMDPAIYYIVGMVIYFWAYSESEMVS